MTAAQRILVLGCDLRTQRQKMLARPTLVRADIVADIVK
jgi:hypothetical protein